MSVDKFTLKKNKHTRQYFYKPSEDQKDDYIIPSEISPYLRKTYPSNNLYTMFRNVLPYKYPISNTKSIVHFGQLKLFIALADFLLSLPLPLPSSKYTFVYAGAAPGTNIFLIEPYFRHKIKKYILVDPSKFIKPNLEGSTKLLKPNYSIFEIYNCLFTDELLETVNKHENIVFMSDIRFSPKDENVIADNELQLNWVLKMNPIMASLKFRTPYTETGREETKDFIHKNDVYPYLKGVVEVQAFAPLASNESRLIITPPFKMKNYSISEQENRFFTFNRVYRGCAYIDPNFLYDLSGGVFDACYDCTHFYMTAKQIVKGNDQEVMKFMLNIKDILAAKL